MRVLSWARARARRAARGQRTNLTELRLTKARQRVRRGRACGRKDRQRAAGPQPTYGSQVKAATAAAAAYTTQARARTDSGEVLLEHAEAALLQEVKQRRITRQRHVRQHAHRLAGGGQDLSIASPDTRFLARCALCLVCIGHVPKGSCSGFLVHAVKYISRTVAAAGGHSHTAVALAENRCECTALCTSATLPAPLTASPITYATYAVSSLCAHGARTRGHAASLYK